MEWEDGTKFKGIWKNDFRLEGKLKFKNGEYYEGFFEKDLYHGKGRLYYP